MNTNGIRLLSDERLLRDAETAAAAERGATAHVITLLGEIDVRRLYLQQGYSSMFVYCTRCLCLSEHAAYGRIEAARAARKFPIVLDRLADGSVTLTTICLLSNHLTADNCQALLDAATHKSRREVEKQVAAIRPSADAPSLVRKLPESKASTPVQTPNTILAKPAIASGLTLREDVRAPMESPVKPPTIRPLAPERYKVQFTIGPDTHRKLRDVQDLLRHTVSNGDIAQIFDRAITVLLQHVQRRKLGSVPRPRSTVDAKPTGRHIPAATKREVWARDRGQCAFIGVTGHCDERGFLEFHHVVPFAEGGETSAKNLELRCRAHNAYEARQRFGVRWLLRGESQDDFRRSDTRRPSGEMGEDATKVLQRSSPESSPLVLAGAEATAGESKGAIK
jgi:hypothetical protein